MIRNFENIRKGTKLITNQLGTPTRATAMESIKQGKGFKNVLLVDVKGSDIDFLMRLKHLCFRYCGGVR